MTAWSLKPMDQTLGFLFVILCQAFTAVVFSLFVGLCPKLISISSEMHAQLGWYLDIESATAGDHTSLPWNLGCFHSMFWITVHLYCKAPSINCMWLNVSRKCRKFLSIHPAACVFSHIIQHQWLSAMHAHTCGASTMFYRTYGVLWIMICSYSFPYFLLLNLICPKNTLPEQGWVLQMLFGKD